MTDEPENLVLVYLRRLDSRMGGMEQSLQEVLLRLGRLETGQARIRQELAGDSEVSAHIQAQIDRLRERVDRIDRRLDLVDE